jgi:hypothetical protein
MRNRQAPRAKHSSGDASGQSPSPKAETPASTKQVPTVPGWPILSLNTPLYAVPDKLWKSDISQILALEFIKHRSAFAELQRELASGVTPKPLAAQLGFALAVSRVLIRRAVAPSWDISGPFTMPVPGLAGLVEWSMEAAGLELASTLLGLAPIVRSKILPTIQDATERAELAEALMIAEETCHAEGLATERELRGTCAHTMTALQRAALTEMTSALVR